MIKGVIQKILFSVLCSLLMLSTIAQTAGGIQLKVTADRPNWEYKLGEIPVFKVAVERDGQPLSDIKIVYTLGLEKMAPQTKDSITLKGGEVTIDGYALQTPGFLRLSVQARVDGQVFRQMATAAFEPTKIEPTVAIPADFVSYWDSLKNELVKIPLVSVVEPLEELSTTTVGVYQVSINNIGDSKVYGILSVPKKPGKYPAALQLPGAGVRGYKGDVALADEGVITLQIGIHGIPVTLPDEVYKDLNKGALKGYPSFNLDSKDNFYYKRVYLGCLRALDFLVAHSFYDGENLAVYGGSQGGALSIVTAALDRRVKYLAAFYPALSDMTGYLYERAGGWPHYFSAVDKPENNTIEKLNTVSYYDVVNFAKILSIPGFYSWGFNDEVCPPTSMYAMYNSIGAPKSLSIYKETGHFRVPEQQRESTEWLLSKLRRVD